jgi:hypothetical protein
MMLEGDSFFFADTKCAAKIHHHDPGVTFDQERAMHPKTRHTPHIDVRDDLRRFFAFNARASPSVISNEKPALHIGDNLESVFRTKRRRPSVNNFQMMVSAAKRKA